MHSSLEACRDGQIARKGLSRSSLPEIRAQTRSSGVGVADTMSLCFLIAPSSRRAMDITVVRANRLASWADMTQNTGEKTWRAREPDLQYPPLDLTISRGTDSLCRRGPLHASRSVRINGI